MEVSSKAIKTCWQDILCEKTLQKEGVVNENNFSSLMKPFAIRDNKIEPGTVILQWLNLVASGQGMYKFFH